MWFTGFSSTGPRRRKANCPGPVVVSTDVGTRRKCAAGLRGDEALDPESGCSPASDVRAWRRLFDRLAGRQGRFHAVALRRLYPGEGGRNGPQRNNVLSPVSRARKLRACLGPVTFAPAPPGRRSCSNAISPNIRERSNAAAEHSVIAGLPRRTAISPFHGRPRTDAARSREIFHPGGSARAGTAIAAGARPGYHAG